MRDPNERNDFCRDIGSAPVAPVTSIEALVIPATTLILRALLVGISLVAATGSPIAEAGPGYPAILDVCEAGTLEEAAIRGGRLGWPATPPEDQKLRNWRTSFERHNGGTVRIVAWDRDARDALSYWVASGPNAHAACNFSTDRTGLLEALRDRLGPPDTSETHGVTASAFWRRGGREVSFTQVGARNAVNVLIRRG